MSDGPEMDVCVTCGGTGEVGQDYGVVDCPDCGGSGRLPSEKARTEWRVADIERRASTGKAIAAEDVTWLTAELRKARTALTAVVALAHDAEDTFGIDRKIRFTANDALGLYRKGQPEAS
ncbi:MAG TPA: hypothetical protein VLC09_20270 [Polyangiaceae bacterium]|nr:hypothetical protein [Polyangiaceae bacterium]